jgi:hypothetical protein
VSWRRKIDGYIRENPRTGKPATTPPSPDTGFLRARSFAATAQAAPYLQPDTRGLIVVFAGQLNPGVNPGSAIRTEYTDLVDAIARARHIPPPPPGGFQTEAMPMVAEPARPLGGRAECWEVAPSPLDAHEVGYCMWTDASTYGILSGEDILPSGPGGLASQLVKFRAAMEH